MKDLTKGSVTRWIFTLAALSATGIVANILSSLANIYWVGRLGPKAQASGVVAMSIILTISALTPIMAVGTRALVGRAVGGKKQAQAEQIFNEVFGAAFAIMLLATPIAWLVRQPLGTLLAPDPETAALVSDILKWLIPAVTIQFPTAVMAAALTGTGDPRPVTATQLISLALGMTLSPAMIFGWVGFPSWGVAGIGIASFVSALICGTGLLLCFLRKGSYLKIRPTYWMKRSQSLGANLRIGLPTSLQSALTAVYMVLLMLLLRRFGPDEQAAVGIGQRLIQSATMPFSAFAAAISVMTAQNFGGKRSDRVRASFKASMAIVLVAVLPLFLIAQLFSVSLSSLFSDDPVVVSEAAKLIRIMSIGFLPTMVATLCGGALSGFGNTIATLKAVVVYVFFATIPAWLLSGVSGFNSTWVWILSTSASYIYMLTACWYLRAEYRKRLLPLEHAPAFEGRALAEPS